MFLSLRHYTAAFVVLVLSTMNLLVGFLSTLTIAGVVTTVMGAGVKAMMGWELGVGESIAAVRRCKLRSSTPVLKAPGFNFSKLILAFQLESVFLSLRHYSAVILIGLSVDYCVHLANAFTEAPASAVGSRAERTRHALTIMGVSITASAATTVISGQGGASF